MAELDFESFWADLRPKKRLPTKDEIRIVSGKAADLGDMLEETCVKVASELTRKYQKHHGESLTVEILTDIVSTGVRTFMERWHESLRRQNLTGLIEFVLEGQSLTPQEMTGFVRALPMSLLERICNSVVASASGIHGLMAVEHARRRGIIRSYVLQPKDWGKIEVEFINRDGQKVSFYLDEGFDLPKPEPDVNESSDE
jgi:hypothetical protein